jgi:hypothetical protein
MQAENNIIIGVPAGRQHVDREDDGGYHFCNRINNIASQCRLTTTSTLMFMMIACRLTAMPREVIIYVIATSINNINTPPQDV